jgi:hypothetical protein
MPSVKTSLKTLKFPKNQYSPKGDDVTTRKGGTVHRKDIDMKGNTLHRIAKPRAACRLYIRQGGIIGPMLVLT